MWSADDHTQLNQDEDHVSRDHPSPFVSWRNFQWPAILTLFAISLTLGYVGFSEYAVSAGLDLTPADTFYRTLQLAALESGAVSGRIPWELEIARWALPFLTAYTAVLALATIFRQQFRLVRLRFLNSHIIICGLGAKGLQLAERFADSGYAVVAIERDAYNSAIPVCNELGITTLVCDARESACLKRARADKAKQLIAVCGDDGTNLEIAVRARQLNRDRRSGTLTCTLHLTNPRLYTLLREEEFGSEASPNVRLEVFNLYERGARELIRAYPVPRSEQSASPSSITVMIIGLAELGKSVLIQIAREWHMHPQESQPDLSFILLDSHAEDVVDALLHRFPRMSETCALRPVSIDVNDETALEKAILRTRKADLVPDIAYVCLGNPSAGFQTALQLRGLLEHTSQPVIVSMPEDSGLAAILQRDAGTASSERNIHPFDIFKHTCTLELILLGSHELMARAVHEHYLDEQMKAGEDLGSRRALVPWDSLPEDLRDSNRRQVDLIRVKLERAGCGIKPLVDWDARSHPFSETQIDMMARLEHQHWMDERVSSGWTFAPGPEDPVKRTHAEILPWEELSEQAKAKDRQTVTSIPRILVRAGFQIDEPG
jgi:hypothetical protein